ncbi:MAG: transcription-repair coupling factor [Acholeplasmatales bacterium]|nr:transcription-repair coupling factor [Acholeplasmatales bacterium]
MNLFEYFSKRKNVNSIINSNKVRIGNSTDNYNLMLVASDFYAGDKSIVIVLPNLFLAQRYYDSLTEYLNNDDVLFFPSDELISIEMISSKGDFLFERIQTIYTLLSDNSKKIIITNLHGAIRYEMNSNIWKGSILKVNEGGVYDINDLCKILYKIGYKQAFTVTKTGEFSRRGSILDIFPLGYESPIRIDFFDDEIETIKTFNLDNQRSIAKIDYVNILPVSEFIYDDEDYKLAKEKIEGFMDSFELSQIEYDMYKNDLMNLSLHNNLDTLSRYLEFFDSERMTIFDFVKNKRVYVIDPVKCKESYDRLVLDINDSCGRMGGYSLSKINMFKEFEYIDDISNVSINGMRGLDIADINVYAKDIVPYNANSKLVLSDIKDYYYRKKLIIAIKDEDRIKKLNDLLNEAKLYLTFINDVERIDIKQVNAIRGNYPAFELSNEDFVIINESSIFEREYKPKKAKYKSVYKNATKISRYDELVKGDYVVHYDYGVGRYLGIETLDLGGLKRDVLTVEYAKNSRLYVSLEQISSIMKYASKDTVGIKIHSLGDLEWARTKAKVRKKVHDISDKLIALYAKRRNSTGFKYSPDSELQEQFESEFDYDLTLDQEKAVRDVKKDMESDHPMDRLICGDVGYGKTEVALRAAFKACYDGKQVACLAPTTILARQHYQTFKSRMEKYGINVEMLSRLVSSDKQKKIIEGVSNGKVDVIIGTHRLLSDQVKFHDLGLLIIDEEQRFGVTHKEKIKELKINVDCITLSATPIPRTLQMSMVGIKDLSMIETPPKNRYPIQTYVIERNDKIIHDAIERELIRGGQVFYLYNLVDSIDDMAIKLHNLVPEAKICVAHGRMTKEKLESVIEDYIEKKYDVLLCTTIIETGIDMPDTNTLIIHDADRLGLSQMYQIRGRVGRSNKIAYAYLMYEPRKVLTSDAEKRLATIKEFNELGSGFKIAMRDLAIRGSGDLLGEEQSGFVESVGVEMYLKILDEEINHPTIKEEPKPVLPALVNRTISDKYIPNDDIRIEIHKRIDKLEGMDSYNDLCNELIDRFGEIPNDLVCYMEEKVMKNIALSMGIDKIENDKNVVTLIFNEQTTRRLDGAYLFDLKTKYKNLKLTYQNKCVKIIFNLSKDNQIKDFDMVIDFLIKVKERHGF